MEVTPGGDTPQDEKGSKMFSAFAQSPASFPSYLIPPLAASRQDVFEQKYALQANAQSDWKTVL